MAKVVTQKPKKGETGRIGVALKIHCRNNILLQVFTFCARHQTSKTAQIFKNCYLFFMVNKIGILKAATGLKATHKSRTLVAYNCPNESVLL